MDNTTYVTHYDSARNEPPPLPSLQDYIEWLQGQLAGIPEGLQASAEIETGYEGELVAIRYQRPATPEEMAERLAAKQARAAELRRVSEARRLWEERLAAQRRDTALLLSQLYVNAATGELGHINPAK